MFSGLNHLVSKKKKYVVGNWNNIFFLFLSNKV